MIFDPKERSGPGRCGPLLSLALAALCAACGGTASSARTSVTVEPVPAPAGEEILPALPVSQVEELPGDGRRVQMDVVNQDLRLVLRSLAENFGMDYSIDPSIQGRVTTRLSDASLTAALDALVLPHGYQYQIQGNVLRVTPTRLQTRMFSLDYVSLSRFGVGTTVVQRRLGAGFGGAGGLGAGGVTGAAGIGAGAGLGAIGAAAGADMIQRTTVADLWREIQIALEGLVFDTVTSVGVGAAQQPAAGFGAGVGGLAAGAQAYSRVGAGGTRLIINPLAGVITITAPPEKLAQVEAYLATIERSVQRQVLIEAKIVEVLLNREYQFGIDWGFVRNVGDFAVGFGMGESGAQLRLDTRSGDPEATINLVLRALESQGDVSVLSNPRVSVLNNQPAVFGVTTEEVFFSVTRQPILGPTGGTIGFDTQIIPQQISVGITLDVVAQIASDNVITMNIRPVVTDVISEKSVELEDGTQATAPVIDRRETDTMARVRGGETIVIGGLMQTRQSDRRSGVPGLRSLPGVGSLFGGTRVETEKRELVIFITPRIVAGQIQTAD